MRPTALLAIAGSSMVIFSIFLCWGTADVNLYLGHRITSYSGLDLITDTELSEYADVGTVPLCAAAVGAACLALSVLPLFRTCRVGKVLSAVNIPLNASVVYLILSMRDGLSETLFVHKIFPLTVTADIGLWFCLAGCIVAIAGSLINIAIKEKRPADTN